jgi:DNA-binding Lrp family transcriptional regulator
MTRTAAKLKIPRETLRVRIKRLRAHFSLYVQANLYHTHIGLRKISLTAESKPGFEQVLYQYLKTHDYWLYVSQCIGVPRCTALYGIPAGHEEEFEQFAEKLKEQEIVKNVSYFWTTCIHNINTTGTWFDSKTQEWTFPWDKWIREIHHCQGELPFTLREPDGYFQRADWIDIMILKELEKDYTIKFRALARKLAVPPQLIKYHYENHIIKDQMLEGPQVLAEHFKGLSPDTCLFLFAFPNHENLRKFALSMMDKPFARAIGKTYGKNRLFARLYLPRQQTRNFIEALSKLVQTGFLESYEYLIEDLSRTERQTISYEFFKDSQWEYNHEKYLRKLQSTAKNYQKI